MNEVNKEQKFRACYTQWGKSEREKHISYFNTHIWNLEKWYWLTYLQGNTRDADIENRLVDTVGDGEGGMNWESSTETYTLLYVKQIASGNLLYDRELKPGVLWQPRGVGWHGRWQGGSKGRIHVYTYGWFTLLYGRNQHNTVKQLSFN